MDMEKQKRKLSLKSVLTLGAACLVACGTAVVRPVAAAPPAMDERAVLDHLNSAIRWYRHLANVDAGAGSPGDVIYLQNARGQGLQALKLAFDSASQEARLIGAESGTPQAGQTTDQQNIAKAETRVAARLAGTQAALDAVNRQIGSARGEKRKELTDRRDALQGEMDLDKALQEGISKLEAFVEESEKTGLAGKIKALKATVPELAPSAAAAARPAETQAAKTSAARSSGLFGQASLLFAQMGDVRAIDGLLSETAALKSSAENVQGPLRDSLRGLLRKGREAIDQPAAAGQAGPSAAEIRKITAQFRSLVNAALPLRQETILLDQVRANLLEWRKSVEKEYGTVLRALVTHVLVILGALLMVVLFSEIWRRATYRYVHEARRRRQVLLLRRFVTGFLMAVVIIMGFVSEFHSLATFAGFLTAGIAVALQTVILSVAAYFFLIGRYGVRVGDRITVSGVTGDVIDIGLVRMHLLELAGTGIDLYPTGRVVVFSNSALFQASPLFKQIPGTAYTWHEAVVPLAPTADRGMAEKRLLEAVNAAYATYGGEIERQHGAVERLIEAEVPAPAPQGKLRLADGGIEFVARYPVDLRRASDIDREVLAALAGLIAKDGELASAVCGPPTLRAVGA